jgi:hypothetical protein
MAAGAAHRHVDPRRNVRAVVLLERARAAAVARGDELVAFAVYVANDVALAVDERDIRARHRRRRQRG